MKRPANLPGELPPDLTPRELEVLRLVARGHTNREVAATLGITHATVRNHVVSIFLKVRVTTRAEAVASALRSGLID